MHLRLLCGLAAFTFFASSCSATPVVVGSSSSVASTAATTDEAPVPPAPPAAPAMTRDAAVDLLINQAFLPARTAGCVVDEIHQQAGVYNPNSAEALAVMADGGVVADCTADPDHTNQDREFVADVDTTVGADSGWVEPDLTRMAPFELDTASMPALNPGGLATGSVEIGDRTIEYVTVTPAGFTLGDTAPVFLAFGPGGQDLEISRNVVDVVFQDEAVRRGWVVVSPASSDGSWHDGTNAAVIPEFMSWMQAWVNPENGKPHIGGMSNGGISAFHIAVQIPSAFQSLIVYPGYPRKGADSNAVTRLANLPVRMWVGGKDSSWVSRMESVQTRLTDAGGDVELWVLEGEPHILESTQDGVAFFDQLDNARVG